MSYVDVYIGLLRLGRPINMIMGILALLLGASVVSGEPPTFIPLDQLMVLALAGALVVYSIMCVNDIVDVNIDRVNAPWRPIASGLVPVELAWRASVISIILGLGLTLYVKPVPQTTLLAIWFLGLAHFYNLRGKRLLLLGNIIVAFLTSFPLVYGAILASFYKGSLWGWGDYVRSAIFWAMVFLSVLGREIAKGIADIEGDRVAGVRTIANTYGARVAAITVLALYLTAIALSLIPPVIGVVNTLPYLAVILPVDVLALAEGVRLVLNPGRETALSHKGRILILMLISMIGLYMGSMGV